MGEPKQPNLVETHTETMIILVCFRFNLFYFAGWSTNCLPTVDKNECLLENGDTGPSVEV